MGLCIAASERCCAYYTARKEWEALQGVQKALSAASEALDNSWTLETPLTTMIDHAMTQAKADEDRLRAKLREAEKAYFGV